LLFETLLYYYDGKFKKEVIQRVIRCFGFCKSLACDITSGSLEIESSKLDKIHSCNFQKL